MNQNDMIAAIGSIFPTSTFQADYTITVTDGVPSIRTWNNSLGTQPTIEQIQAALDSIQLSGYKQQQLSLITAASQTAQTTGFVSSALGSPYTYPSSPSDQANLTAVITGSMIPAQPSGATYLFWCKNSAGFENFVSHTAAQIQQVGLDALAAIMAGKSKQLTLSAEIQAATTIAGVQAIVW